MPSNGTATQVATEKKLYRIGEVSLLAALKPFVLRYWETEFPMLEPVKISSGHRLYRQDDVDMVFRIKRLLEHEGISPVYVAPRPDSRPHGFVQRLYAVLREASSYLLWKLSMT